MRRNMVKFSGIIKEAGAQMKRIFTLVLSFLVIASGTVIFHSGNRKDALAAILAEKAALAEYKTTTTTIPETEPPLPTFLNEKTGFLWPAEINAEVISRYPHYSSGSYHGGIDIGVYDDIGCNISEGTLILAAKSGVVTEAYNDGGWNTGFGNHCVIDHGDGIQTLYAHAKEINVSVGDEVSQGDIIGIVGDTGNTTAPHLHFEVRSGNGDSFRRLNPLKFISQP